MAILAAQALLTEVGWAPGLRSHYKDFVEIYFLEDVTNVDTWQLDAYLGGGSPLSFSGLAPSSKSAGSFLTVYFNVAPPDDDTSYSVGGYNVANCYLPVTNNEIVSRGTNSSNNEVLVLYDPSGNAVDAVSWGDTSAVDTDHNDIVTAGLWSGNPVDTGTSCKALVYRNADPSSSDTDTATDWTNASDVSAESSPGEPNPGQTLSAHDELNSVVVKINEVCAFYNDTDGDSGLQNYIELYVVSDGNPGPDGVDLSGWYLNDLDSTDEFFVLGDDDDDGLADSSLIVHSGDFVLIWFHSKKSNSESEIYVCQYRPLSAPDSTASSAYVQLSDGTNEIDSIPWSANAATSLPLGGWSGDAVLLSFERDYFYSIGRNWFDVSDGIDTNTKDDWHVFTRQSPGLPNGFDLNSLGLSIRVLPSRVPVSMKVDLLIDIGVSSPIATIWGVKIFVPSGWSGPEELKVEGEGFDGCTIDGLTITEASVAQDKPGRIILKGMESPSFSVTSVFKFEIAVFPKVWQQCDIEPSVVVFGDVLSPVENVVISEIRPSKPEFIELTNISDQTVNITNWMLAVDGRFLSLDATSVAGGAPELNKLWLDPGEIVVIVKDDDEILDAFYSLYPDCPASSVVKVKSDKWASMPDYSGQLYLYDSQETVVDCVTYRFSERSRSLERVSLYAVSTPDNWAFSKNEGTPGFPNSVASSFRSSSEFCLSSSLLKRGQRLLIGLNACGNVEIRIYDSTGNVFRHLLRPSFWNGSLLVAWDGSGDGGRIPKTGIYWVFVRTGKKIYKKPVVVCMGKL